MSIRVKIVALFLILTGIFFVVVTGVHKLYIIPHFNQLEQVEAQRNIARVLDVLSREITHLDVLCHDWSAWNDTYEYINDRNQAYYESNLEDASFDANNINIIFYFDLKGNVVWSNQFDFTEPSEGTADYLPSQWYQAYPGLFEHPSTDNSITGFIVSGQHILMVSARPIIKSDESGPIRGTLVMGRVLNNRYKGELEKIAKIPLYLWRVDDSSLPSGIVSVKNKIYESGQMYIDNSKKGSMHIYSSLRDIKGEDRIILEAHFQKEIVAQAVEIVKILTAIVLIFSCILFIMLYAFIHTMIIKPVIQIREHVAKVKKTNNLMLALRWDKKGEIGEMSRELDLLFDQLNIANIANEEIQRQLNSKHELLKKMTITDVMTSVYNRRYLTDIAQSEFARAKRHNTPLSIAILDVDNFKKINDFFGHQVGDEILKSIAVLLKKATREEDYVARYGGEEFVVLAPVTDHNAIFRLADRLRSLIEENEVEIEKDVFVGATASFGVATYINCNYENVDELLRDADDALLKAKRDGRNRVHSLQSI
ncbi:MAG: diguanylate cyclase [Candidatus Auribacterota bacterium]